MLTLAMTVDPRLAARCAALYERERSVPPTVHPKRYQRRKVGHTRPITSRLAWRRALCG